MGKSDKQNKRKPNKKQGWEKKLELDGKQKLRLKRGEKQNFEHFAKAARKVGLLVSKDVYLRYFRAPAKVLEKE